MSEEDVLWFIEYEKFCANQYGITEEQRKMIATLKAAGFGWAKYAESVEKSGKCSENQDKKLREMLTKIRR